MVSSVNEGVGGFELGGSPCNHPQDAPCRRGRRSASDLEGGREGLDPPQSPYDTLCDVYFVCCEGTMAQGGAYSERVQNSPI